VGFNVVVSHQGWNGKTEVTGAHGVVGYHARLASLHARGVGFNSQCVHIFPQLGTRTPVLFVMKL
jgi:hypothetical protein